ncbi:MAG TPA: NADH-quinone oxidoreductase subunit L, partial [Actinoplanes sp.]|nr:NADH-quinone oxidoreductase subunit L [Actinoplanes sp.]
MTETPTEPPGPPPSRRTRRPSTGAKAENARVCADVCQAAGCLSLRSDLVAAALVDGLTERGVTDVAVKRVGCLGLCAAGPLIRMPQTGELFEDVNLDSPAIDQLIDRLAKADPATDPQPPLPAFFARQTQIVLENSGRIDPEDLDDYLAHDGYRALRTAVNDMTPHQVVEQVVTSGLRGRGGAGFPVGIKWQTVAKSPTPDRRYVVCNADEGDPGAFMDRSVLESDPHRVLEGMAIAAYAVGADTGFIYCRAEYPLAVRRLRTAIRLAKRAGVLGENIAGTGFSFNVEVRLGAGAFVCGEETALLASIEGGRGTPRPRPPYPAVSGLHGRPTLINNVETFANVPPIIRHGGAWYAGHGVGRSKGTKVFALAGRVVHTGLIEIPMGMTLREVVYDIGGGVIDGRPFKAVQTGGPSGGCLPAELLDIPLDYESLAEKGSIIGSGGMIVMDDTSCMVDIARYFMTFSQEESCG